MCAANGVALILFGHPVQRLHFRGATRSASRKHCRADQGMEDFEVFLAHCDFCLCSEHGSVVELHRVDTFYDSAARPAAQTLLPKVHDWNTVLSRYRFHVEDAEQARLLQQEFVWTLKLRDIRLDESMPSYDAGEEYLTSVVCLPQSWLRWVDNAWFRKNIDICWFMQRGDTFGVPSRASVEKNQFSCCAVGRHYFRTCFVPNQSTTAITAGTSAVSVSAVPLVSPFTDSEEGILFPQNGYMYVILFDVPSSYAIERQEVRETRECVLCADECAADDAGLVMGTCGHYVCRQCYDEFRDKIQEVTQCFYCRRATSVCVVE